MASYKDIVAIAACILFPFAIYLPFGFSSSGHWENWIVHSYFEGGPPGFFGSWIVSRFAGLVNRVLAYLITSESFTGYNFVNCLMHSGMTVLFYGTVRLLRVSPLYAFLMSLLFVVFPVNPMLLSLRSMLLNFSKLSLLAAIYLALEVNRAPRRLTLAGVWLALMFSINSYESGMALIFVLPLVWWLSNRQFCWRNLNLTATWYLVPALKVAYVVLLTATNREFYQSGLLNAGTNAQEASANFVFLFVDVMRWVYRYTFLEGWQEAVRSLELNEWWVPTSIIIVVVVGVAWYLARKSSEAHVPTLRQISFFLIVGVLLIIPAVGVLMWISLYNNDPWRMLLYVPIGATIAVFSAILLLTSIIRDHRNRHVVVASACLLLLVPAISRLFLQLDYFVDSADKKARVLYQVLDIAPDLEIGTEIALVTHVDNQTLQANRVFELLHSDMLLSAFHVLYQDRAPQSAYFCTSINRCGDVSGGDTIFSSTAPEEQLQRTLVFKLNEDLSIELVEDPATFLGLDINIPYDATQLYDPNAPLPSRATTMLGAALRG